jgi:hypothetical protein
MHHDVSECSPGNRSSREYRSEVTELWLAN